MSIKFNEVTWYSKLAAVIVFVGFIFQAWYIAKQYQEVSLLQELVASHPAPVKIVHDLGGDVVLGVGESATFDGLQITFDAVTQDNRCPVEVDCSVAGAVTAQVTMRKAGEVKQINLSSDDYPYNQFGGDNISIVRVIPRDLHVGVDIGPKDYIITFRVAENLRI